MLTALVFLASHTQPVSAEEFRLQAQGCGVSLKFEPRGEQGYAVTLSQDRRNIAIRSNLPRAQKDCMFDWARQRGLSKILIAH